ncbi:MAG: hypothetical protein WKF75_00905 [Singulisphaera sp.]
MTLHFPPSAASGAFRMLGFARHLPKFGWRAAVVAPPTTPLEPVDPDQLRHLPPRRPSIPYPTAAAAAVRRPSCGASSRTGPGSREPGPPAAAPSARPGRTRC